MNSIRVDVFPRFHFCVNNSLGHFISFHISHISNEEFHFLLLLPIHCELFLNTKLIPYYVIHETFHYYFTATGDMYNSIFVGYMRYLILII